jgi:hypothetical protein
MKRMALSLYALRMLSRIPNFPEADAIATDGDVAVLTYVDDGDFKRLTDARMAAANNKEFLMQLARETRSPDSIETRMQRWSMWLRHGMLIAQEAERLE